ncbi:MAG: hypothetical protein WKF34_08685 [Pyrinomonadaceae bacterium]
MLKPLIISLFAITITMSVAIESDVLAQRKSVPASEVNGTFRMSFRGAFKSSSSRIKILALGGGRIRVAMDLIYPYTLRNGELMVNMGRLDDEFEIDGETAVYKSDDGACRIELKFRKPGTVDIMQNGTDGECGFGHNVNAAGAYRKISSRKPRFDNPL